MPITPIHQALPPDRKTLLALYAQPALLRVSYDGVAPPGAAVPSLLLYLDGQEAGSLTAVGQSADLQARRFEAKSVGGTAIISLSDPNAPALPVECPVLSGGGTPPSPRSAPARPSITASILNPDAPIRAVGGTRVDVRCAVGIVPEAFRPGAAHLTVEVFDAAGAKQPSGFEQRFEVDSDNQVIGNRSGMVRPNQVLSVHLTVTANDGSRIEATKEIKTAG